MMICNPIAEKQQKEMAIWVQEQKALAQPKKIQKGIKMIDTN